jgi:hypothetical protein
MDANVKAIIDRAKNLKEFTVITDRPEELYVDGVVPFDLRIDDKEVSATILAESFDEAASMLHEWLYGESN